MINQWHRIGDLMEVPHDSSGSLRSRTRRKPNRPRRWFAASLTMLPHLLGCTSQMGAPAPQPDDRPPPPLARAHETPIRFDRPEFGSEPMRVREKTIYWPDETVGRSIVALFWSETEGAWAEIVYAVRDDNAVGSRTSVEGEVGWLYPSEPLFWDARGSVDAPWALTRYRLFSMPERDLSCVGFSSGWNHEPDDPLRLPTERLAGVYCRPEVVPVDETAARDVIRSLQLRLPAGDHDRATVEHSRQDAKAARADHHWPWLSLSSLDVLLGR